MCSHDFQLYFLGSTTKKEQIFKITSLIHLCLLFFSFFFSLYFSSNIDCRIIAPAFRMLVGKISTDNG